MFWITQGEEKEESGQKESELYEHIKDAKSSHDAQVLDVATETQQEEQAMPNREKDQGNEEVEENEEVEMRNEEEEEEVKLITGWITMISVWHFMWIDIMSSWQWRSSLQDTCSLLNVAKILMNLFLCSEMIGSRGTGGSADAYCQHQE